MSAICARLSKGKVGVQRGRETAGVPSFLPSAVGTARRRAPRRPPSADGESPLRFSEKLPDRQGRTRLRLAPRPAKGTARQGRTRLRQFVPRSDSAEKEPPVRVEPACGSSCAPLSRCRKEPPVRGEPACGSSPGQPVQKRAARQGRTRLRQFVCPGQPVQKRSRPLGANPPAAVRVPRSAGAAKGAARQGRTRLRQFVCPGHLVPRKEKHRRIASTVLKVCTFTQIAAAYRHPYAPAPAGPVPDDRAR